LDWDLPLTFEGVAVVHPHLGVACDLYGLGMLLFRSLLCNERQEFATVESSLLRVIKKLELDVSSVDDPDASYVRMVLERLLAEEGSTFHPRQLVYLDADRDEAGMDSAIPALVWRDLLHLGFRLVSVIRGFSYALHHADSDPSDPARLMRHVLADLDRFRRRLDVELFGRGARDQELSALCNARILELGRKILGATVEQSMTRTVADDSPGGQR
jgi:hypothetical protein